MKVKESNIPVSVSSNLKSLISWYIFFSNLLVLKKNKYNLKTLNVIFCQAVALNFIVKGIVSVFVEPKLNGKHVIDP